MKAIMSHQYGPPEILQLDDVDVPQVGPADVLVRVHAASVNPLDWHFVRGEPYVMRLSSGLRKPKEPARGVDLAGVVEAVGADVRQFKQGDAVFGGKNGAFAEFVCGSESNFVSKPPSLTFEQAAAIPIAGISALQGLRTHGRLAPGQSVLINGASGGVGTFCIQIAKLLGAEVTGVCSTGNLALLESLGADHVIDYTRQDFTRAAAPYDLIVDTPGNRTLGELRRALSANGTLVLIGGGGGTWMGPISLMLKAGIVGRFVDQRLVSFMADLNQPELQELGSWAEEGTVVPVIGRTYSLEEAAEAVRLVEGRHARGKVVITVLAP